MKLNSPILYLLLSALLCSCSFNNSSSDELTSTEKEISSYLDKLASDTLFASKVKHAEKAIQLSKQTKNPTFLFKSVLSKMDYVVAFSHPDSMPVYFDKLAEIASKTPEPNAYGGYIHTRKAEHAFLSKQYQKAYDSYHQSNTLLKKESDSLRMIYNLLKMGEIQQIYNDYSGSEETITEALALLGKIQNPDAEYTREAYNKLGISYTGLKEYSEAIKYYNKAKKTTDDPISQKIIDNNIALCYLEQGKYNQAVKRFAEIYQSNIVKKDTTTLAKVADNLGYSMFKSDGNSGRDLMEEALSIRTEQADEKGMVYSYLNLANFYESKNSKLATNYAQKAYTLATKIGALDHRLQALELLSTIGNNGYNQQYFQLNDSINNFRLKAKNHFAKMRFDASEAREENAANRIKQAEDKTRNLIVAIIMGIFVVAVLFLFFLWKIRHRREKQQQKRDDEYRTETRIAKKLHDELANDIFNTMTFAEYKDLETPENKEALLDSLDKIYAQTRNISKENNTIDTGEKYLPYLKEMISSYGSSEVNIIINEIDIIDWTTIESSKKITLHRVLQELMVNMKKHSKASIVLIGFKKTNKKIQINYSDNGVGMGSHGHFRKNGLQNVENRIQSINGTITFDPTPQKGFKVHFSFNA